MFLQRVRHIFHAITIRFWWVIIAVFVLTAHFEITGNRNLTWPQRVKQFEHLESIRVIVQNAPESFQNVTIDFRGLDRALAQKFTEALNIDIKFIEVKAGQAMIDALHQGAGDFAVGTLSNAYNNVSTTKPIVTYQLQLIRHTDTPSPKTKNRNTFEIVVAEGSREARALALLGRQNPDLTWTESRGLSQAEIFHAVATRQITFSAVLGPEFRRVKGLYPDVVTDGPIGQALQLGWSFSKNSSKHLIAAANHFIDDNQVLIRDLIDEYVNHPTASVGDIKTFKKQIEKRLPKYEALFHKAAKANNWDPLMLIAVAYQESHLNPRARSPTGVRGIMMLTLNTMKELGYDSRLDPKQSIEGGAKYLAQLRSRLPIQISEPDRTWFTLAAYNMGLGHLEDARSLTKTQGGNPDRWLEVSARLPLLQKREFYAKSKYGYGRGKQAQKYVENIRTYYELLLWRAEIESDKASSFEEASK